MASKQLTVNMRLNTSQFEGRLKRIARGIDALNNSVRKGQSAYQAVNEALRQSDTQTTKIKQKTEQWKRSADGVTASTKQTNSVLSSIGSKLKSIASTYLGIMGAKSALETTDTLIGAQNRLNYVSANTLGSSGYNSDGTYSESTYAMTQDALDKMYASSQKVRTSYTGMMSNVSRNMALAGKAFDNNIDNAIRFQEIMAEAYAIGGATAQEMHSSMYQMTQALGAGILAGDELRSVREGAPLAYQKIEEFAQGIYGTTESLKELASEGKITSDIVVAAIMNAGSTMDNAFKQTKQTFGQTWDQIKNTAMYAFQPVMESLSEMLERAVDSGLVTKFEKIFTVVANGVLWLFDVISNVISWIASNWDWLKYIVVGALILITSYLLIVTTQAIAGSIMRIAMWMLEYGWILVTVAAVLALLYVFYLWKTGAIDTCQAIVTALMIVGAAVVLIGLLTGSWVMVIVGLIIAAIGLIINYLDYFLAVIYSIASVIWNIIVTLVTIIIKNAILPLTTAWDNFANFFGNLFNDPVSAIIRCFEKLADSVLSILETIAKGIDSIFGSNLSGTVQGWRNGLSSAADSLVEKYGNGTYEEKSNLTDQVASVLDSVQGELLWSTSDAWNTGMEHGAIAKDWLSNLGSEFQNWDSNSFNLGSLLDGINGFAGANDLNYDSVEDLLGDIGNDTGSIADNMELTKEDLEYLRRIAEMEWKKEYTTASITVDMSNYNTISGDGDLDGIVEKLADKLYDEMNALANGVYE